MLIHPLPDPIAFSIGPVSVHWYGLMYMVAFIQFIVLGRIRAAQPHMATAGWKKEDLDDMLFYGVLGVVLGGRLGEVIFYNPGYYFSHPLEIFAVWKGGMSFHGGFLGVMAALYWYSRKIGRKYFQVLDFIAPIAPFGLGAGRLGNFIGGELWGRRTDVPWGMVFPHVDEYPRHASQLYQFALEGIVLFSVMWWFSSRPRPLYAVSGLFGIGYGSQRFFVEFFREPDEGLGFVALDWLTMGQILSLPMIIAGVILMCIAYRRGASVSENHPGTSDTNKSNG